MERFNTLRVFAVTDEIAMMSEHAKGSLKGYDYQLIENQDATQNLSAPHGVHGLVIDVVTQEKLSAFLKTRLSIGFKYDLITVISFRVRNLAGVLQGMLKEVRSNEFIQEGIRIGSLPVAAMNRLELVSNPSHPLYEKFKPLFVAKEFYVASPAESFPELAARAVGSWWINAVSDLRYQGVGLQIDESGAYSLCGAYSRPLDGTFYFSDGASPQSLGEKVWRVKGAADTLNEAIIALNEALNQAAKATPKQQEPILQKCFERYPELLAMGLYDTVLPQKSLKAPDPFGISIRPDFIAMNSIIPGLHQAAAVIELKSPEMRLRTAKAASREFRKALEQLDVYRRYFADSRTAAQQTKKLGRTLTAPKLLLIIGRNAWRNEWLDTHAEHPQSSHIDTRIASYDDVCDLAQNRLGVLQRLNSTLGILP